MRRTHCCPPIKERRHVLLLFLRRQRRLQVDCPSPRHSRLSPLHPPLFPSISPSSLHSSLFLSAFFFRWVFVGIRACPQGTPAPYRWGCTHVSHGSQQCAGTGNPPALCTNPTGLSSRPGGWSSRSTCARSASYCSVSPRPEGVTNCTKPVWGSFPWACRPCRAFAHAPSARAAWRSACLCAHAHDAGLPYVRLS